MRLYIMGQAAVKPVLSNHTTGFEDLKQNLSQRKAKHLYRSRKILDGPQGAQIRIDNRTLLNFCSNDYLGLANHPEIIKAFQQAANTHGVGSGASHLVNGHSRFHHDLEIALAEFTGRERALLFSTGYMANLGALGALMGKGDAVFQDRLNHASLLDAGLLSGARSQRYHHADMESLQRILTASKSNRKLIVSDGVFSMDGDLAPVACMAKLAASEGAWLMIDDAHGLGCIGKGGRGTLSQLSLSSTDVPVLVGTLGKAFGTAGAFVAGSEELIETLIQYSRTYIYTTALPSAVAAATIVSLKLVESEHWRRKKLAMLVCRFRNGMKTLPLQLMQSETAIQPVLIGDTEKALKFSEQLLKAGILVSAIRPPTVPDNTARLRVTISASHSEEHIDILLDAFADILDGELKQNDTA